MTILLAAFASVLVIVSAEVAHTLGTPAAFVTMGCAGLAAYFAIRLRRR